MRALLALVPGVPRVHGELEDVDINAALTKSSVRVKKKTLYRIGVVPHIWGRKGRI